MKKSNWLTTALLMLLAAAVATVITYDISIHRFNSKMEDYAELEDDYEKFSEIMYIIENNYIGEYNKDVLMDSAMAGLVDGLGDVWSYYMTEDEYESYQASTNNSYVGIGISSVYDVSSGDILIKEVFSSSPADNAGIVPFDRILAVNGANVADSGYDVAAASIRGEVGGEVSLTIYRSSTGQTFDVKIIRQEYRADLVKSQVLSGNIGYMKIRNFDTNVDKVFTEALNNLKEAKVSGIVFDVRDNPGGSLTMLMNILDQLLPEGTMLKQEYKDGSTKEYTSDAACIDIPMVVLINGQSYSAAEFFAAALSEYGVAQLVGDQTTGKGYAQVPVALKDGSAMVLSTSRYYTPNGLNLAGTGLTPHVSMNLTESELVANSLKSVADDAYVKKGVEQVKAMIADREATAAKGESQD